MKTPDEINMNEENAFLLREAAKSASAGYYDHLSAGGKGDPAEERWIEALIAGADALAYIQQLERERDAAVADLESVDEKYESLKSMIDDVTFNHEPYGLYLDFREAADAMVEHEHADVWRDVKNTRTGVSDSCTGASGV